MQTSTAVRVPTPTTTRSETKVITSDSTDKSKSTSRKKFTKSDFANSETARNKNIENTLPEEYHDRADMMISLLDDLQESWGSEIKLTSGYRSKALNDILQGSSKTSVHMQAYAMDIVPANGKIEEFIKFIKKWSKDKDFDQILIEKSKSGKKWIHFGLYNNEGKQRRQIRNMSV